MEEVMNKYFEQEIYFDEVDTKKKTMKNLIKERVWLCKIKTFLVLKLKKKRGK